MSLLLLLLSHLSYIIEIDAQTQLTPYYGYQINNDESSLNQGRITSFGAWKCWGVSPLCEWKFRDWTADNKTDYSDNYGDDNERNVICQPFKLSPDDFIVGYTIYANGYEGRISGLKVDTRNSNSYSCVCRTGNQYTVSFVYGPYDFWYLTGWNLKYGDQQVNAIQFQFTKYTMSAPSTTTLIPTISPTSDPTYDPSLMPAIQPSMNPSMIPSQIASTIPTDLVLSPSNSPFRVSNFSLSVTLSQEPTVYPKVSDPTRYPTDGPTNIMISDNETVTKSEIDNERIVLMWILILTAILIAISSLCCCCAIYFYFKQKNLEIQKLAIKSSIPSQSQSQMIININSGNRLVSISDEQETSSNQIKSLAIHANPANSLVSGSMKHKQMENHTKIIITNKEEIINNASDGTDTTDSGSDSDSNSSDLDEEGTIQAEGKLNKMTDTEIMRTLNVVYPRLPRLPRLRASSSFLLSLRI